MEIRKCITNIQKGDRHQTQNYRPVALTSISCKILKIIVNHILNHFDLHKILTKLRNGFRSGLSFETQRLQTANDFLLLLVITLLYSVKRSDVTW